MNQSTARRRSPWRITRRLADVFGAQLIPGRHYQFGVAK
jgi:hypothetical protein